MGSPTRDGIQAGGCLRSKGGGRDPPASKRCGWTLENSIGVRNAVIVKLNMEKNAENKRWTVKHGSYSGQTSQSFFT